MIKVIQKISANRHILECNECGQHYEANYYDAKKSHIGHLCKLCCSTSNQVLDQKLMRKFFLYNPTTGDLIRRLPTTLSNIGDVVGGKTDNGYLITSIGNKTYLLHRLIWLYVKGYFPKMVDHINHDRLDNRWNNLREVDDFGNAKNTSVNSNSTTKVNGVSFSKQHNKYRAYITVNKKHVHLGLFTDINDAIKARRDADVKYGFHPNHGN